MAGFVVQMHQVILFQSPTVGSPPRESWWTNLSATALRSTVGFTNSPDGLAESVERRRATAAGPDNGGGSLLRAVKALRKFIGSHPSAPEWQSASSEAGLAPPRVQRSDQCPSRIAN